MMLDLQREIRALRNPEKAKVLAGFFKTGPGQYGEGDKFLGVTVPQTRFVIKKYSKLSLDEIGELLQSEFHEERLAALLILVFQFQNGNDKIQKSIFEFYLQNTGRINSWDLVDLSAPQIVGAVLAGKPKDILFALAGSKSLWERRIAMVATFFEIKNGRGQTTLAIAEKLLNDKHDLMHKAVGWMLREVGKRCSQKEEEIFLQKYAQTMPRTMLRYAIERFDEKKRQQYLKYGKGI
jgi:3-methyladenine DNA glycosylase AlkD